MTLIAAGLSRRTLVNECDQLADKRCNQELVVAECAGVSHPCHRAEQRAHESVAKLAFANALATDDDRADLGFNLRVLRDPGDKLL